MTFGFKYPTPALLTFVNLQVHNFFMWYLRSKSKLKLNKSYYIWNSFNYCTFGGEKDW